MQQDTICVAFNSIHIPIQYRSIAPVLVLGVGALVLLAISAVLPKRSRPGLYAYLTALIGVIAAVVCAFEWSDISDHGTIINAVGSQIIYDHFTILIYLLISIATVLGALTADHYLVREGLDGVEPYVLMLMSGLGAMLMAASGGTVMLFLGLEIMSIALYVMTAYHRRRSASGEAGLKYFILGSFSSAIFLYGAALAYGATGSTQFNEMASFLAANTLAHNGVLLAGMLLLIIGLGFKVAAVPFHFWTPDVYQGAPTPFTGYMAAVAKAGGFAGLVRILVQGFISQQVNWRPVIWLLAVLTLLLGSVLAIVQRDLKRMLAYSSISQAGYVLIGLQAGSAKGVASIGFYLFTYTFIIAGTFAVVQLIQGEGEGRNDLGAIRGLARRSPLLAFGMTILLLAQAGVPLTSGFLGKFYVIQAVVNRGQYPLAVIGMLAAAIAAFFYLRIALLMYSSPSADASEPTDGVLTAGLGEGGGGDTRLTDRLLAAAGMAPAQEEVPAG
ncbi:MAG: NADH-quinone oxidoreductase subunit N, partial [Acidimicrobiaceae bacterium]|nr:NADH-quinone oxidoreductase subunit N [Acidimicrobiaceae bacterium]